MLDRILIDRIERTLAQNGKSISKIYKPATENQIAKLKAVYSLPNEFYDLLRFSDGIELFNLQDLDGFDFCSVEKLIEINSELVDVYEEKWTGEFVVFCIIIGEGNYLAVKLETGEIVDGFHEQDPAEWKVISPSLTEFLTKLLDTGGETFWL